MHHAKSKMRKTIIALVMALALITGMGGESHNREKQAADKQIYGSAGVAYAQKTNAKNEKAKISQDELIVCFGGNVSEEEIKQQIGKESDGYEILSGAFEVDKNLPKEKQERLNKYLKKGDYDTVVSIDLKDESDLEKTKEKLEQKSDIQSVNYSIVQDNEAEAYGVNDTYSSSQNYLNNIKAQTAWNTVARSGYTEIWVAQIDTGLCLSNPDFGGVYLKNYSVDVTTSNTGNYKKLADLSKGYKGNHGTLTSGVTAAKANNSKAIAGVGSAYDNTICKLMAIDASSDADSFYNTDLIKAIQYAVSHGAEVINMSLGGYGYDTAMQTAINNAHNAGVTLIASMGNDNSKNKFYPADYNYVISVSATDKNNVRASFSNYGHEDICAPGVNIVTTGISQANNYVSTASGTSLSAPMVSATAAMMKGINME